MVTVAVVQRPQVEAELVVEACITDPAALVDAATETELVNEACVADPAALIVAAI